MEKKVLAPGESADGGPDKRLRLIIISVAVLAVAAFGVALYLAMQKEDRQERWDILDQLRKEGEPTQDPLWNNPYGVYNPERMAYVRSLELFLDKKAAEAEDALEPQTRFHIAKTLADHILSNPGILDQADRSEWYAKAVENLEQIRDRFPDFPLNWTLLSEDGFPSLTRQFIQWLEDNEAWEREHMLRAKEPSDDVRVLVRTTRGDLLLGLYRDEAPTWTSAFLERAVNGHYDGTAFVSKRQIGDVSEPEEHTLRAGGEASRNLQPFDAGAAKALAEKSPRCGEMPEESRNLIPHQRGIVSAWHDPAEEYDHDAELLFVVQRSPILDYKFTPIGKLLEENGIASLATLDDIFAGETYSDDNEVRDDPDLREALDWLRVPAQIVKVLVYEGGNLREPREGQALPTKAAVTDKERTLSSLEADAYKVDRPQAPGSTDPKDEDTKDADPKDADPKDDEPKDDDADK